MPGTARQQAVADLQLTGRSRKFYRLPTEHESKGRFTQRTCDKRIARAFFGITGRTDRSYWPRHRRPLPSGVVTRGHRRPPREACRFAVAPIIDADQGNGAEVMQRSERRRARLAGLCSVLAVTGLAVFVNNARAEQPPAPCHPNPTADADETAVRSRGDVVNLPGPLQDRLAQLANRPHTYLPVTGVQRSRRCRPIVPVLSSGHHRFRTQRLYYHNPRSE